MSGKKLRCLELFAGVGGQALGLEKTGAVKVVAYCEIDPTNQNILESNMRKGAIGRGPIFDDVKTLTPDALRGCRVDMIAGGFPCQDMATLGKRVGMLGGTRSSLVKEVLRLVRQLKPRAVFLENVPPILHDKDYLKLLRWLDGLGYDSVWKISSARSVGAKHVRRRWFLLAVRRPMGVSGMRCPRSDTGLRRLFSVRTPKVLRRTPSNLAWGRRAAFAMGNSAVPACVNKAFTDLFKLHRDDLGGLSPINRGEWRRTLPGAFSKGNLLQGPDEEEEKDSQDCSGNFTIIPPRGVRDSQAQLPLLKSTVKKSCAPTARTGQGSVVAIPSLTSRTLRDLGNFLLSDVTFRAAAARDGAKIGDAARRDYMVHPHYLSSFMGFPSKWMESARAQ